ncbi:MAG TPA: sensor histidine kinase [Bacillales bacterium]|nr:sensor histidine kinase [Bacillales bacterium]
MLIVIIFLTAIFSYIESKQIREQTAHLALQTAKTVTLLPSVQQGFLANDPSKVIEPIAEHVREEADAAFVTVGNRNGIRYSFSESKEIDKKASLENYYSALVFGGGYHLVGNSPLGPALMGIAPIFRNVHHGREIVGFVSVGYLIQDIRAQILSKIIKISLFSLGVLLFGTIGGVLLARNIRKDTLGLEPYEIAALYRERSAILQSIKEGILAIDENGFVTMMNASARRILGLSGDKTGHKIEQIIPNTEMYGVLEKGVLEKDREMHLQDQVIIVNRVPIFERGRVTGVVSSFRDKTEVREMVNTLSEVRKYSEDLRAQTHEFTNKLYVLSGLLQLGRSQEALDMIQTEMNVNDEQNHILFNQIHDTNIQAILLGKIGKASEKKVNFVIDENSSLHALPEHMELSQMITILGNLIDNAYEAVSSQEKREVAFFTTDVGDDIVFEVSDNGTGIYSGQFAMIFEKGFSSKEAENRGYGLANVKEILNDLEGTIEVENGPNGGAVFSVFIPKTLNKSA